METGPDVRCACVSVCVFARALHEIILLYIAYRAIADRRKDSYLATRGTPDGRDGRDGS